MNAEVNIKKEGIPCRILAGLVSIPFLIGGVGMLLGSVYMLLNFSSIGWGILALIDAPINLYIGFEGASVALQGKTVFLFKSQK